jgi:hypothetical protein
MGAIYFDINFNFFTNTNNMKQWFRANAPTCINIAWYIKMSPAGIEVGDKMYFQTFPMTSFS